jgi:hypothetical protein
MQKPFNLTLLDSRNWSLDQSNEILKKLCKKLEFSQPWEIFKVYSQFIFILSYLKNK